jgi:hypothetical protein
VTAAHAQTVRLPGEDVAADLAADLAREVMALSERIGQVDGPCSTRCSMRNLCW